MEFKLVERPKKKGKNRKKKYQVNEKSLDDYRADLDLKRDQLKKSGYYKTLIETLDDEIKQMSCSSLAGAKKDQPSPKAFASLRCLGLGSPSSGYANGTAPTYQLALIQLLIAHLSIEPGSVSLWDPIFTDIDKDLFASAGFNVEEGTAGDCASLLFLPHCPVTVIDTVLASIYASNRPALMIGNGISEYDIARYEDQGQALHLARALKDLGSRVYETTISKGLIQNEAYFEAFNSVALLRFEPEKPEKALVAQEGAETA